MTEISFSSWINPLTFSLFFMQSYHIALEDLKYGGGGGGQ